jgi:hypothetical protein
MRVSSSCLRGANVVVVQFGLQPVAEEHEPYPSGLTEPAIVQAAVAAAFPELADTLSLSADYEYWRFRLFPEHVERWQETAAFKWCLAVRERLTSSPKSAAVSHRRHERE